MKLAFIFPGQGSQYVGMGREIHDLYPQAREIFEQAAARLGIDICALCFEGPAEELNKTVNAQPAILTVSMAYLRVIDGLGLVPAGACGHSLGEYTALVAAGSLDFSDAVWLVRERGRFMQEAVALGRGGMAAILGLDTQYLDDVCQRASSKGIVEAVNLNCPGQVVLAGENEALEEACSVAREMGAKRCVQLPVSAPFHSSLMRPAGGRLARELAGVKINDPRLPVVANVSASYVHTGEEIRQALVQQVSSPVRWQESIEKMIEDGFGVFFEIGPGRVLAGLNRKINRHCSVFNTDTKKELEDIVASVAACDSSHPK